MGFGGRLADHDLCQRAREPAIRRGVVESTAGDQDRQQVWCCGDDVEVQPPGGGELVDVAEGFRELKAAVVEGYWDVGVDLPGEVNDDCAVLAAAPSDESVMLVDVPGDPVEDLRVGRWAATLRSDPTQGL